MVAIDNVSGGSPYTDSIEYFWQGDAGVEAANKFWSKAGGWANESVQGGDVGRPFA
jgi:hypothetical protein